MAEPRNRNRKSEGTRSIPINFDERTLALLDEVVEQEQQKGSRLTRAALVRWCCHEALAHSRPPIIR